jgi:hypothetical protein
MQVRSKSTTGFDKILTSNDEASDEFFIPQKKPFVIFRLPQRNEEDLRYYQMLENKGFALLALPPVSKDGYLYITVTNENKVVKAIKRFLSFPEYHLPENKELLQSLKKFARQCVHSESRKTARHVAPKSKLISNYIKIPGQVIKSRSNAYLVAKRSDPKKIFVFKPNATGRSITEIEAFNGMCWQGLLGERHPEVRSAHDAQGNRVGVLSRYMDGFESVFDRATTKGLISKDDIVNSEMSKVLVPAYSEEEMDFHTDNNGFDKSGFNVKLDDGRSTWSYTSRYVLIDPEKGNEDHPAFNTPPIQAFQVTEADIAVFPFLLTATPCFWIDSEEIKALFEKDAMLEAAQTKKFRDDQHYMFLKRILMPDAFYHSAGKATISNPKKRAILVDRKIKKTQELTTALLATTAFLDYVRNNPDSISQIKDEIADYNAMYPKAKDYYLHINYNKMYHRFHQIRQLSFLKKGVDIYAASDMARDALIGAGIGLVSIATIAVICAVMCLTLPMMGLTIGSVLAGACLLLCGPALLALGAGLLIKHIRHQTAAKPQKTTASTESTRGICSALDSVPLAKIRPAGIALEDVFLTSSSDLTPGTNVTSDSSLRPDDEGSENTSTPRPASV